MKQVWDLKALEPVMVQAKNVCKAAHVSFDDYLSLFSEDIQGRIRSSALRPGVTHLICFENLQMDSSDFGHRMSLAVGSEQQYKLDDVLGKPYARLGDVPSRFLYPVAYASVEEVRKALPPQERAA